MAASRTLEIIIRAKDLASKSIRGIGRSMGAMRSGLKGLSNMMFGLKGAVAGLAATIGATVLGKSFLNAAVTAERYRMQLKILTGSQKSANELFQEGADLASSIAYEYEDVMGTIVAMRGVIKGGNEEVVKWTKLIADVAAATGIDIQTTTQQITRMYSAGAQSAELFKERGKLAMLGFTTGVSYSVEETRKKLMAMWEDPESALHGAAKEMSNTWEGMMSMIADSWFQFRQMVMEKGGVFDYIKALAKLWLEFTNRLKSEGALESWATSMGQVVIKVLELIIKAAGWVADAFRGWKMIWDGLKLAALTFGKVINGIMIALLTAVQKIIEAYQWLLKVQLKIGRSIEDMGRKLQEAAARIPLVNKQIAGIASGIAGMGKAFADSTQVGIDNLDGWVDGIQTVSDNYANATEVYDGIIDKTIQHLDLLAQEVPYHEKMNALLKKAREYAEAYRLEREKISGEEKKGVVDLGAGEEKKAKAATVIASNLDKIRADAALAEAELEKLYKNNEITAQAYYKRRREMIEEAFAHEIAAQQELAKEAAKDPDKLLQIETRIYEMRKQLRIELIKLNQEEMDDEKRKIEGAKEAQRILSDITGRAATTGEFGIGAAHAEELRNMDNRQREEIDRLNELVKQGYAERSVIEEAYRQHALEKDKLLADQRYRLVNEYLNKSKEALNFMADSFKKAYEASGKKQKEFFIAYKAAAIAMALIDTYQAAQAAYKSMVGIPYVGGALAVAAAAAAIAAGLARVNAIRQQELAAGGEVKGYSPSPKADNIPIRATAGEYVQPVSAVKYYGTKAMDALRTMRVPRDVVQRWADRAQSGIASISRMPANLGAYQAGGLVAAGGTGGNSISATTNVSLPETLDALSGRLQTEIESTVVNVLKEEFAY